MLKAHFVVGKKTIIDHCKSSCYNHHQNQPIIIGYHRLMKETKANLFGRFVSALILRGLDALTSEDSIIAALNTITALPIKNVCVIKDELTSTSKGYAFLEMNSLRESSQLLEMLAHRSTPLEVDGKAILVSYAKNTYTTV